MTADIEKRNIVSKYWNWTNDLIKEDLQKNSFPYAVLIENLQHDFNISGVIRNANAFSAKEIFYIGHKKFDRRGMVGVQNYSIIKHLKSMEQVIELKNQYTLIAFDNNLPNTKNLESFEWPKNPLMIFGTECEGISKEMLSICDVTVTISQYGTIRSLNCAVASGIAMYEFTKQFSQLKKNF